jgi:hypothetical protein
VHGVSSGFAAPLQPPVALSHIAFIKQSSQVIGVPGAHVVAAHLSFVVHGSPSSQAVPGEGSTLHPVAGSHVFLVHGLVSEQSGAGPPTHLPARQASWSVHLLLSLHGVASAEGAWLHCWVAGLQVSTVHGSLSLQSRPTPPHLPPVHLSPVVHALPSSQVVLSVLLGLTQPVDELHESVVQSFLSSQEIMPPGWQAPLWHESPWVQTLLSVHGVLLATGPCTQAPEALQASVVQGFPSSVQPAPAGLKPFGGQTVPLQVSARSHSPVELRHTGLGLVPSEKSHAPLTHRSCVQRLPSLQVPHAAPFLPQAAALWLPGAMHTLLLTQPVQHAPLMQTPLGQGV